MSSVQKKQGLFLLAVGFLLYANTIPFDYALDDKIAIINNKFTKQGVEGIDELVTNDSMVGFFGRKKNLVAGGRYRPLALVTHAIEWELFGENPHVSHFINALLYALTCILVYLVLAQLIPPKEEWWRSVSFLAVLIWAAHPLHTEVVANIKSRDELMSTLFAFGAFYYFIRYFDTQKVASLLLVAVLFALSIFSKESSITFLAAMPLSVYFFRDFNLRKTAIAFAPLLIVAGIYLAIRHQLIGSLQTRIANELMNNPFLNATFSEQIATAFYTFILYLKLLVFPHPLTHDYYPKQIPILGWENAWVLLSVLIHIGLAAVAVIGLKKRSIYSYGILFYFIAFSLYSNILFPIGTFMNERFLYVASLGFCLVVAHFLGTQVPVRFQQKSMAKAIAVVAVAVLSLAYTGKTITRNYAWENDETLALTDAEVSTNSAKVNMSAGLAMLNKAKEESNEALRQQYLNKSYEYLKRSLEIYPGYLQPMLLMGNTYSEAGNYESAIQFYENCLEINPEYSHALQNLEHVGDKTKKEGNYQIAKMAYETYIGYKPDKTAVYGKLGEVYGKHLGNLLMAEEVLATAYQLEPQNTDILQKLGVVYAMRGKLQESLDIFHQAEQVEPENARILMNLGLTYNNLGQTGKGQEYLQKAFEIEPELQQGVK